MPSPADRVSREEVRIWHKDGPLGQITAMAQWLEDWNRATPNEDMAKAARNLHDAVAALSAAASVRQEPDWEGVARLLAEALRGYVFTAVELAEDSKAHSALKAFECAAGEGERE